MRRQHHRFIVVWVGCLILAVLIAVPGRVAAINYLWNEPLGGFYTDDANWIPALPPGPPGAGDTATFDMGGQMYVISFDFADVIVIHVLFVGDDEVFFDLNASDYTLASLGGTSIVINGAANPFNGLTIDNGTLRGNDAVIALSAGSDGRVTVTNADWLNAGDMEVGKGGDGLLEIVDGSMVSNINGSLGVDFGSLGDATVSGFGAVWDNFAALNVGVDGTAHLLVEMNGIVVSDSGSIGTMDDGDGEVTVDGTGSEWLVAGGLVVADEGVGKLSIQNDGLVSVVFADIGRAVLSNGTVTVDGGVAGQAEWEVLGQLNIAKAGFATLDVKGGGDVTSGSAALGVDTVSLGEATVDGGTSSWEIDGTLFVGQGATLLPTALSGELTISGGALVTNSGISMLGVSADAGGKVTVTGANSTWSNTLDLFIGNLGRGEVVIENGGFVESAKGYLAFETGSTGTATVKSGSTWLLFEELIVGHRDTGTLQIEGGSEVISPFGTVGFQDGSDGHVTVTGANSKWTHTVDLWVGFMGEGTLDIEAGGEVSNDIGVIGVDALAQGANKVTVTGANSKWINASGLIVAGGGSGELLVEDAGLVTNVTGVIGAENTSNGSVIVTGPGSKWTNTQTLTVGDEGMAMLTVSDNGLVEVGGSPLPFVADLVIGLNNDGIKTATLLIESGGSVTNINASIADNVLSVGHAIVTGPSSTWTNLGDLTIGALGVGTMLVEAGAVVSNVNGIVTEQPISSGEVLVTGANSQWNNTGMLAVGNGALGKVTIELGGALTSGDTTLGSFEATKGDVIVKNLDSQWDITGAISIGTGGQGTLLIQDQAVVITSIAAELGTDKTPIETAQGIVTITDAGSLWQVNGPLTVGVAGEGDVTVELFGHLETQDAVLGEFVNSDGDVAITDLGSLWNVAGSLTVGLVGTGHLSIKLDGLVTSDSGVIGAEISSDGTVIVFDADSLWAIDGPLTVGDGGKGLLLVGNGAQVLSQDSIIAVQDKVQIDSVQVRDADSEWIIDGDLTVARSGTANARIFDGGTITNHSAVLGELATGIGDVDVGDLDGPAATWQNAGTLTVGQAGTSKVTIRQGSTVTNTDAFVGKLAGAEGIVELNNAGSTWTSTGSVYIGGSDTAAGGMGQVGVGDMAAMIVTNDITIWPDGFLGIDNASITATVINNHGKLEGEGTINAAVITTATGIVVPGDSPGILTINGNYQQNSGALLKIELAGHGGAAGTDFDLLASSGTVNLAGTLDLDLIDALVPTLGETFEIITATGGVNDIFDLISGVLVNPGLSLAVIYNANDVTVHGALPGDADLDGFVNLVDLNRWLAGGSGQWSNGDLNGDGDINLVDLNLWLSSPSSAPFKPNAIPEPATMALILLGLATLRHRHRP